MTSPPSLPEQNAVTFSILSMSPFCLVPSGCSQWSGCGVCYTHACSLHLASHSHSPTIQPQEHGVEAACVLPFLAHTVPFSSTVPIQPAVVLMSYVTGNVSWLLYPLVVASMTGEELFPSSGSVMFAAFLAGTPPACSTLIDCWNLIRMVLAQP